MQRKLLHAVIVAVLGAGAGLRDALGQARPHRPHAARHPLRARAHAAGDDPRAAAAAVTASGLAALDAARVHAAPGARRVLDAARAMITGGVVVRGSCYTWLRAVYARATGRHQVVYAGSPRPRFARFELLRPGDWVFFINHSYRNNTHSAIFVGWADPRAHVALMASYVGGNRTAPGRFSTYALTNVYQVVRMADDVDAPAPTRRHHDGA
ncbi:MAG: hypothetical protein U0324_07490 [Polyangiales bacterium]